MSNPIVGITDSFEFATVASPSTFTTLAGVMSISESGEKVENSKTTVMGQSVDTFIASTTDPGSFDLKCFFFPGDTTQVALEAIKVAGAPVAMKALYGTSNTTSFSGIVESLVRSFPLEKPATLDVKIKVTGAKVYV